MKKWKDWIIWFVVGVGIIAQFVLSLFFFYNWAGLDALLYIGWAVWVPSLVLGWMPILVFRRGAGVQKGEGYIHTTVLVDNGIYAVVRHPQYLSMILLSLALILISQHWLVAVIGVVAMVAVYLCMREEDGRLIEKFGDDYVRYIYDVPRANILVGLVRLVRRGARQHSGEGGSPDAY
jgi:protein-S-isoprenylcysteine O-methyltransferase Ste14